MTDLRLCELLAARICHDLVGPVGAVSNGIELLGPDGSGADTEVVQLIGSSARVAGRRLQAFRVAFGSANAIPRAGCIGAVRELAMGLVEEGKTALDWPPAPAEVEAASDKVVAKVVLNLVLIALDSMLRGGTVRVLLTRDQATVAAIIQGVNGQGRLADEIRGGLEGVFDLDASTPKAAPAYLAACLVRAVSGSLTIPSETAADFEIRAKIPARS